MTKEEEIKSIEEELAKTKYNKATQGHIGRLKAKMAKLKEEERSRGGGTHGVGYGLKKNGDATVVLVGFPSVGKSTLLNRITNADSKVGAYDFTTLSVIPGVMEHNGAKIQILDVPGIINEAAGGKGRGKEIFSVVRIADMIVILLSPDRRFTVEEQLAIIERELYDAGIRLNKRRPQVKITKKTGGGIDINLSKSMRASRDEIVGVLNEFGIYNAEVVLRENVTIDQIVDCILDNRVYVPSLVIVNKADLLGEKEIYAFRNKNYILVSTKSEANLEKIKDSIWGKLGLIRVYLKRLGKEPDLKEPLIIRKDSSIKDVCEAIHKVFMKDFKFARLWGPSSKFPGQKIGIEHKLKDKDIVELHVS